MAETAEKFLKKYYKQLHFNSMPAGVRAQFFEWVKNGTLTNDMSIWVRDYLQHDAHGNLIVNNGQYVPNALPNPIEVADLPDEVAKELYVNFQKAFAKMASKRNSFKDSDHQSIQFLDNYFGNNKLFNISKARPECATGIQEIVKLIKAHPKLVDYILRNTKDSEDKPVFKSEKKLTELLDDCTAIPPKYNSDSDVQSKIQNVAETLSGAISWYSTIDKNSAEYRAIDEISTAIDNVTSKNAFAIDADGISSGRLSAFRNALSGKYDKDNVTGLLQTLYFNKNVRSRFAKYDDTLITGPIEDAEGKVNYQDKTKDNYVDPKISDKLTPLQQIEQWASDTYDDTIKKYEELRGAQMFYKQEAKDIFKAIDSVKIGDKKGIKPSDGLQALLDNEKSITDKIKNPVSRQHFKWFVETMTPIASKMPKAIAGAWKNADQMKAVIDQIILKATEPGATDDDMEKAKSAMEIMTAMKYGMMTSKIMDAMKKTEFNIFSDGKLSWNNNEGIQFVTKAFDQSIKAAFLGVGYGVTIIKNNIMLSGRKYTNKDNQHGVLAERFKAESADKYQEMLDQQLNDQNTLRTRQQDVDYLRNTTNYHAAHQKNYHQVIARQDAIIANHDKYIASQNLIDADRNDPKRAEYTELNKKRKKAKKDLPDLKAQLATYAGKTDAVSIAEATAIQQQIVQKEQIVDECTEKMKHIVHELRDPQHMADLHQAFADINDPVLQKDFNGYNNAVSIKERAQQLLDSFPSKIEQFNEATAELAELNNAINARNAALANWPQTNVNRVVELQNYWNFLQGNNTFVFSTKGAQKRFDATKQQAWADYIANYGLNRT